MSSVSYSDVETVVKRALGQDLKILNHRLESFSKKKNGIFGSHQILQVNVQNESNNDDSVTSHTFFVKGQPDSPLVRDHIMDESTFSEEVRFYKEIHPCMTENFIGERWSPKCYHVTSDIMIFEDLRAQNYVMHPHPELPLTEQQLKCTISTLARFHASSIIAESRLGTTFKDLHPDAFEEKMYTNMNRFGKVTVVGYEIINMMAEDFGMDPSLVPKIYNRVYKLVRAYKGTCNVICHGDLWKNNIMFNDGAPLKCILVDYQLLRYITPVADLVMLLYVNTTPEFRKESENDMFKHYYSAFRDTLLQNGIKSNIPSYENLLKDYQVFRLLGMTYSALYLPGMYMRAEDFAEILNNPVALERYFFHSRTDVIRSNMDDPNYVKKMKSIMDELFQEAAEAFKNQREENL